MALYAQHQDTKFRVGDTVKVSQKIVEGEKSRTQIFEGLVIKIRGHQGEKSFTVRKISSGIGVERIYPLDSPMVEKIEVNKTGIVRRAKLYYLRQRTGRDAVKVKARYTKETKKQNDSKSEKQTKTKENKKTEAKKAHTKKTTAPKKTTEKKIEKKETKKVEAKK